MELKKLFKDIKKDLQILKKIYNVPYLKAILSNRGFHSLFVYRISNFLYKKKVPIFPLILTRVVHILYGVDIDYKAELEGGIIIIHGIGTVIGKGTKIKSGTIIYHQVTLGIKGSGKNDGFPSIENNCILGAGSKLLGKINIGKNCIIGANVVVSFDVPNDSIVKFSNISIEIKSRVKIYENSIST